MILESALHGLEIQRNRLDEQIEQVRSLLGRRAPGRATRFAERDSEQKAQPKRRRLSAAARRRISATQKKRWKKVRAEQRLKEKSTEAKRAAKKSKV
jgi:peptidoglycan hydrolase CwlO-like protein